ncbi:GFA family protein [Zavarzinia sp. CC-PAN008]|uniref:GFA family protein n=1 Tax=Zavarzinia sp. CC-PAN008 TaxID=3243332 RepID=UPI003F745960
MPENGAGFLTGGCQCGAIRYRVEGTPLRSGLCTCRMCQKALGGPFLADIVVPTARLTWTRGRPADYRSSSDAVRSFCASCGTPLGFRYLSQPDERGLTLFSLDDPRVAAPTKLHGAENKPAWLDRIADLPVERTDDSPPPGGDTFKSFQHPDRDT